MNSERFDVSKREIDEGEEKFVEWIARVLWKMSRLRKTCYGI